MAVFVPGYQWVTNPRNGGGTYATDGPSSILLHMTVSMGISAGYISGHPYPPHLWANPYNGDKFQTVSLDRSAFALYQPDFGNSWTNKKGYTLQTEVIGVPQVSVATYTDAQCRWIGEQVVAPQARWLASIGRPVNLNQVRYHQNTSGSASENWPGRMGEAEWDAFNGLVAHIDVPYNDHWDCSAERLDVIAAYALSALGQAPAPGPAPGSAPSPTPDSEDDEVGIQVMSNPDQGGDGSVYGVWGPEAWAFADNQVRNLYEQFGLVKPGIQKMHPAHIDWLVYRGVIEQHTDNLKTGPGPSNRDLAGAINSVGTLVQGFDPIWRDTFNLAAWNNGLLNKLDAENGDGTGAVAPAAPVDVKAVLGKASDMELFTEIARRAAARPAAADAEADAA